MEKNKFRTKNSKYGQEQFICAATLNSGFDQPTSTITAHSRKKKDYNSGSSEHNNDSCSKCNGKSGCRNCLNCGEYVFDPECRNRTLYDETLLNSFTVPEGQQLLSFLTDPALAIQFKRYISNNQDIPDQFPVRIELVECLAEKYLGKYLMSYFGSKSSAGDQETYDNNLKRFRRHVLLPRMALAAAASPFVVGRTLHLGSFTINVPGAIFVCPMGSLSMANPKADLLAAKAAMDAGLSFMYSSASTYSPEEVKAANPNADLWFQMYATKVPNLNVNIIGRAKAAGYKGIILTLDTTKYAMREQELDLGFFPFALKAAGLPGGSTPSSSTGRITGLGLYASDSVFNALQITNFGTVSNASFVNNPGGPWPININHGVLLFSGLNANSANVVWDDLVPGYPYSVDWFVNQVQTVNQLPLILKGIMRVDDAIRAVGKGVSGIYVSNHGGRQVNGAAATIDKLRDIADAVAQEAYDLQLPKPGILFDSGIRRGSDVVKAYARGAEWVGVGRPVIWGLGAGGYDGALSVLKTIFADLEITTQNMGYKNIAFLQDTDIELLL